jgi:hypothetical protein
MSWNYRIILHDTAADPAKHWLGLHEVHYDDNKVPTSWAENLATFATDVEAGAAELIHALELVIKTLHDPRFSDVLRLSELNKHSRS